MTQNSAESSKIRVIAGLGNPGVKYQQTRHNIGFLVVDYVAAQLGLVWKSERRWKCEIAKTADSSLLLVKPQTYMNLSGESLGPMLRFLRLPAQSLLAVVDELDLPWGKLRLRPQGSAGGHNGLRSLIQHLGTQEFPRLRLGVGRPDGVKEVVDHVLGRFSPEEQATLANILERAKVCLLAAQRQGLEAAMCTFNSDSGVSARPPKAGGPPQAFPAIIKDNPEKS